MAGGTLLVSSMGTGDYSDTRYSFEGEECETHLCPLAIAEIFDADAAFIPRTEEAAEKHDDGLIGSVTNLYPLTELR